MSNIARSKFAGLLRGLFRRFDDTGAQTMAHPDSLAAATSAQRNMAPAVKLPPNPRAAFAVPSAPSTSTPPVSDPGGLQLPLPSVIAVLPIDLRAKLMEPPPANAFISIPVEKVLSQLAHGAVKISFGELRAARPGLFANSSENDARQIALPLNEIITRISPTLLARRAAKQVDLEEDIPGPFGTRTSGVNPTSAQTSTKTAPLPAARTPRPMSAPTPATTFTRRPAFGQNIPIAAAGPATVISVPITPAATARPAHPAAAPAMSASIPFPAAPAPATASVQVPSPQIPAGNSILVSLSALAEKWPAAVKMELAQANLINSQAALPASLVEPGLKRGRVTIAWKELRLKLQPKPAPVSIHDGVELELPLKVLAPLFFESQKAASQAKHKVSVSSEIPDLFSTVKSPEAATTFYPAPTSMPRPAPVAPASTPRPAPVAPAPVATPAPVAAPIPVPVISAAPVSPARVEPVIPAPATAPVAPADEGEEIISVPLAALSDKWPEAVRQEIARENLAEANVTLPVSALAPAMKCGRVKFAWRDLRSRLQPAPVATGSVHDAVELELPLKVIAPLFLEQQAPAARKPTRLAVDHSIPSPFFGLAEGEVKVTMPSAPVAVAPAKPTPVVPRSVDAKLSETNFYVWGDTSDTPRVDASEYKRAQAPATDFTSRYATPKEIVARAMKLPGVAGVVVALCDGLMIASQVPPELNPDTAAAFLPQIYDRVAQCTRELRMGPLNNLRFTVGNVPWHIFHVNAIYFAAFGHAGESLPTAQLASLAGELDRKKQ